MVTFNPVHSPSSTRLQQQEMFLLLPVLLLPLLSVVLLFCSKSAKASSPAGKDQSPDKLSGEKGKTPKQEGNPSKQSAEQAGQPGSHDEKKEEKKDEATTLDRNLPAIDFLLNSNEKINEQWLQSVQSVEEKTMQYMWGMKKRLAADDNSWKELSKKIDKLKAEGFCVKAGSEETKQMRKQGDGENRVSAIMAKNKAASRTKKE